MRLFLGQIKCLILSNETIQRQFAKFNFIATVQKNIQGVKFVSFPLCPTTKTSSHQSLQTIIPNVSYIQHFSFIKFSPNHISEPSIELFQQLLLAVCHLNKKTYNITIETQFTVAQQVNMTIIKNRIQFHFLYSNISFFLFSFSFNSNYAINNDYTLPEMVKSTACFKLYLIRM